MWWSLQCEDAESRLVGIRVKSGAGIDQYRTESKILQIKLHGKAKSIEGSGLLKRQMCQDASRQKAESR